MTQVERVYRNEATQAFVREFRPLRVYFYPEDGYSEEVLHPLAKALLRDDPRFGSRWLFELTDDPGQADLLTLPCDLSHFEMVGEERVLAAVPLLADREDRHLFFDTRDTSTLFAATHAIHLKTSLARAAVTDRVICVPYLDRIDDFFDYTLDPVPAEFEFSFLGQRSPLRDKLLGPLREQVPDSHVELLDHSYYSYLYRTGGVDSVRSGRMDPVLDAARHRFIDISRRSRFVLAIAGFGLNSFRFYEALSLGVPPVLISEDSALPFEDLIDYPSFCLRLSADVDDLATVAADAMRGVGPEQHRMMRRLARFNFDSYLSPTNYLFVLHRALSRALGLGQV